MDEDQQLFYEDLKSGDVSDTELHDAICALKWFGPGMLKRYQTVYQRMGQENDINFDPNERETLDWLSDYLASNPYILAEFGPIGIDHIDQAVTQLPKDHPWHVDLDDPNRVASRVLNDFMNDKKTGQNIIDQDVYRQRLRNHCRELIDTSQNKNLTINSPLVQSYVQALKHNRYAKHIRYPEFNGVMNQKIYQQNYELARRLIKMVQTKFDPFYMQGDPLDRDLLQTIYEQNAFTDDDGNQEILSPERQAIVESLLTSPVSVLTGYAGTGKTSLLKMVVQYIVENDGVINDDGDLEAPLQLCAFSGKASFNLYQHTYYPSSTIAKLLVTGEMADNRPKYLIIDEISMVDEGDLLKLLRQAPIHCHLILVGDKAQLPAVNGVGLMTSLNWFLDHSDLIPHFDLSDVHRNSGALLHDANEIRKGHHLTDFSTRDDTLKYREVDDLDTVADLDLKLIQKYGLDNCTVITPNNFVVKEVNTALQVKLAKASAKVPVSISYQHNQDTKTLYVGDKVLLTHNLYGRLIAKRNGAGKRTEKIDLFNGFLGIVDQVLDHPQYGPGVRVKFTGLEMDTQTNTKSDVWVEFYDRGTASRRDFHYGELNMLQLGYAITVHKSQGSTIPYAILYLDYRTVPQLKDRQMLYTAYTRGQHLAVLANAPMTEKFLASYIDHDVYAGRHSNLGFELMKQQHALLDGEMDGDQDV